MRGVLFGQAVSVAMRRRRAFDIQYHGRQGSGVARRSVPPIRSLCWRTNMMLVDCAPLIDRLNAYTRRALQNGIELCVVYGHYDIAVEHLLFHLLDDDQADIPMLLHRRNVDAALVRHAIGRSLETRRAGNVGRPAFSPPLFDLLQDAWLIASVNLNEANIRSGAILLALVARPNYYSLGNYAPTLGRLDRQLMRSEFRQIYDVSIEARVHACVKG
ncbi:Clp protease N-terminal domain-containing protein [Burkholderia ubonensis]|nr:Clp protease N-terminal domain-containing protein [Burkholderia ubonensis]